MHTDMKIPGWFSLFPKALHPYLLLGRYDRPAAFWLLFWPPAWVFLFLKTTDLRIVFLFALGSVIMRGAGCAINDILDQNLDKFVERTRGRPLASGLLSRRQGVLFLLFHAVAAFVILLQLNTLARWIGILGAGMTLLYPLMKRWTYWPQAFLGLVFNLGALMAWAALEGQLSPEALLIYGAAVFWTLAYDTVYGFQDLRDDLRVGIKSTAIQFQEKPLAFLRLSLVLSIVCLSSLGFFVAFAGVLLGGSMAICWVLFMQLSKIDFENPGDCLVFFKNQTYVGAVIGLILWFSTI